MLVVHGKSLNIPLSKVFKEAYQRPLLFAAVLGLFFLPFALSAPGSMGETLSYLIAYLLSFAAFGYVFVLEAAPKAKVKYFLVGTFLKRSAS
jgi:hypothetical protein